MPSIFDFITQAQLDELPHDDPQAAFASFASTAEQSLDHMLRDISAPNEEEQWRATTSLQHSFTNVVVGAAKLYKIEPLASTQLPRPRDFDDGSFRDFKSDLDHYMTQLLIDRSARLSRDSAVLLPDAKARIRTHIATLRSLIDGAGISEAKKNRLLRSWPSSRQNSKKPA